MLRKFLISTNGPPVKNSSKSCSTAEGEGDIGNYQNNFSGNRTIFPLPIDVISKRNRFCSSLALPPHLALKSGCLSKTPAPRPLLPQALYRLGRQREVQARPLPRLARRPD